MLYILNDKREVIPTDDVVLWTRMLEDSKNRVVDRTELKEHGAEVSTVFTGLDHGLGTGSLLVFETMVFGGDWDMHQERYYTWGEAQAGHDEIVNLIIQGFLPSYED